MDNSTPVNAKIYTDFQKLEELRVDKNQDHAKKELSQQFEAILIQMALQSMRSANKAFASSDELFSSDEMDMYQDMYDKQLSLTLSQSGLGFADTIEKNVSSATNSFANNSFLGNSLQLSRLPISAKINPMLPSPLMDLEKSPPLQHAISASNINTQNIAKIAATQTDNEKTSENSFSSVEDFVKKLWNSAEIAAQSLNGITPEMLLAQAGLETGWGKKIISAGKQMVSHNLFNIKASAEWAHKKISVETLEMKDGVLNKEKANFRVYDSFKESFLDYVNLLKNDHRYKDFASAIQSPQEFANALQKAGYATDKNYADKIVGILSSPQFQRIVEKVKGAI